MINSAAIPSPNLHVTVFLQPLEGGDYLPFRVFTDRGSGVVFAYVWRCCVPVGNVGWRAKVEEGDGGNFSTEAAAIDFVKIEWNRELAHKAELQELADAASLRMEY
jgi:hypothetical protein